MSQRYRRPRINLSSENTPKAFVNMVNTRSVVRFVLSRRPFWITLFDENMGFDITEIHRYLLKNMITWYRQHSICWWSGTVKCTLGHLHAPWCKLECHTFGTSKWSVRWTSVFAILATLITSGIANMVLLTRTNSRCVALKVLMKTFILYYSACTLNLC